jgi:hypothetical protein
LAARPLKKPEIISETLMAALDKAGLGRIAVVGGLSKKWRQVAGKGMAKHSTPSMLKGGTLTLVVDSPVWMNEISLLTPAIIEKINEEMGPDTVTDIRLRQGGPREFKAVEYGGGSERAAQGSSRPPSREPTDAELEIIQESVASIEDPEVREAARRLFVAACSTQTAPPAQKP